MSLSIRMRRALKAFKADPKGEELTFWTAMRVAKEQQVCSHDPRRVADELVRIAQYPNVPGPIKNMLRVQVMFLHRWMDMVHGKREGNPPIDLNPKRTA